MFPLPYVLMCLLHILGVSWVSYSEKQPPTTLFAMFGAVGLSLSVGLLLVWASQLKGLFYRFIGAIFVFILVGFLGASWMCRIRAGRFLSHLDFYLLRYMSHSYTLQVLQPNLRILFFCGLVLLLFVTALIVRDGQRASPLPLWSRIAVCISTVFFASLCSLERARPAVLATLPEAAAVAAWARESAISEPLWYEPELRTDEVVKGEAKLKRSVLIIVVEALRRDLSLAQASSGKSHMPFLVNLSEKDLMYPRAYAQASDSELSTRTILTGLYGAGKELRPVFRSENSLLSWLRGIGYRTAFLSLFDVGWGVAGARGIDYLSDPAADGGAGEISQLLERSLGRVPHPQEVVFSLDELNVKRLDRWVNEQPKDQPLAAFLALYGTHFPYSGEVGRRFDTYYFSWEDTPEIRRAYEEALTRADAYVASAVSIFLRKDPNAMIFVTGDHGEEFYEHGGYLHSAALSAEVMNVPLAVIGLPPQCPQPSRVSRPVGHIDIVPTVLEALGVPNGMSHQGVSLCTAQDVVRPLFAVSRAFRLQNAVIFGMKKNVISLDGYPEQAFNLHEDPTEHVDLSSNSDFTRDTKRLLHLFEQIQRKHYSNPQYWMHEAPRYEGEILGKILGSP